MAKKLKLLLVVLLIILLLVVGFFLFSTRRTKITDLSFSNPIESPYYTGSEAGLIDYTGTLIKPPQTLNIYKNETQRLEIFARDTALKLNLKQSDFSNKVWLSPDGKRSLSLSTFNNTVQYSLNLLDKTGIKPSQDVAIKQTKEFLASLGLEKNISDQPKVVNFYKGIELVETKPEEAEVIEMFFEQRLDDLLVFTDRYTFSDITVFIGDNNSVIKAVFPPRIDPTPKTSGLKSLDFELVVRLVEEKKGNIIEIATESRGRLVEKVNLGDINLTTATLEYRLSLKDNLIYPYYRFEGTSRIKETGEKASVTIIIPAIEIPQN